MAPRAAQRAAFEEDRRADAGAVMRRKVLDIEDIRYHAAPPSCVSILSFRGIRLKNAFILECVLFVQDDGYVSAVFRKGGAVVGHAKPTQHARVKMRKSGDSF
jgi:hypothetical protein